MGAHILVIAVPAGRGTLLGTYGMPQLTTLEHFRRSLVLEYYPQHSTHTGQWAKVSKWPLSYSFQIHLR